MHKNTDIINIEQIEINRLAKYIKINNLNSVDIIYSKDLPNIEDVLSFNNFDTGTLEFIKAFNDLETIQLLTEKSIRLLFTLKLDASQNHIPWSAVWCVCGSISIDLH